MQTVLEQGSIDKPLTFDVGLIQLSFIPVCSLNTCNISVKLFRGLHFSAFFHFGPAGILVRGTNIPKQESALVIMVRVGDCGPGAWGTSFGVP